MDAELTLSSMIKQDFLIIETDGYINNQGGEKIAEEAYKHIDLGIKKVVLDLDKSKIVNSIGISILIEIIEKLDDIDGKLFFTNLDPTVEKTFNIMGLFQFADKVESTESLVSRSS